MNASVVGSIREMLQALEHRDAASFGVGYVSTPRAVSWVRREGRELMGSAGPLDLDWAYEVRLFGPDGDLRWRWYQDHGRWFVLDDAMAESAGWSPLVNHECQQTRLLRGTARGALADGWTSLWDGQAVPFDVPIELAPGQRAALAAIEYVQRDGTHGTADVIAERFVALGAWKGVER